MKYLKKYEGVICDTNWKNPDISPKKRYVLFLINETQECEMTDTAPFENMEDLLERYEHYKNQGIRCYAKETHTTYKLITQDELDEELDILKSSSKFAI